MKRKYVTNLRYLKANNSLNCKFEEKFMTPLPRNIQTDLTVVVYRNRPLKEQKKDMKIKKILFKHFA